MQNADPLSLSSAIMPSIKRTENCVEKDPAERRNPVGDRHDIQTGCLAPDKTSVDRHNDAKPIRQNVFCGNGKDAKQKTEQGSKM
ncbi:MAG: hypothetical protein A4E19_14360 [Nitrospira sp. SG-bin1]|nr:MAG: hypothetical protein A4E19_14360 [Nitrospira sp. SG-bin1]